MPDFFLYRYSVRAALSAFEDVSYADVASWRQHQHEPAFYDDAFLARRAYTRAPQYDITT